MPYFFTSESVSEGHPDKVSDQISDAILDEFLKQDPNSRVACETLVTTGLAVVSGEVRSSAFVDLEQTIRQVIRNIGYTKSEYKFDADSCGVLSAIHEQSSDIAQGVDRDGAGDQGMMFGYAIREADNLMPWSIELSHALVRELAAIRKEGKQMTYLRPDSKAQVTVEYGDDHQLTGIEALVLSTQHDDFDEERKMQKQIEDDVRDILIPRVIGLLPEDKKSLFDSDYKLHVNPTGKFVIGGPHGDTGLTGRKIIVDTYGGHGAHGGGAFSGKDSSKVDRSAAYATRYIAKNLVAAGLAERCLVQVAYAIGVAEPVGVFVDTYGTHQSGLNDMQIANRIHELIDLRPRAIVEKFGLKNPIFTPSAAYGHMGRTPSMKEVKMHDGTVKEFEHFTWEKLDLVDRIREIF